MLLNKLMSKLKKAEVLVEEAVSFDDVRPEPAFEAIKPPAEQVSTLFNLNGDKSHSLPCSPSGLSYDYWGS